VRQGARSENGAEASRLRLKHPENGHEEGVADPFVDLKDLLAALCWAERVFGKQLVQPEGMVGRFPFPFTVNFQYRYLCSAKSAKGFIRSDGVDGDMREGKLFLVEEGACLANERAGCISIKFNRWHWCAPLVFSNLIETDPKMCNA
jgi:hypothetical protein